MIELKVSMKNAEYWVSVVCIGNRNAERERSERPSNDRRKEAADRRRYKNCVGMSW